MPPDRLERGVRWETPDPRVQQVVPVLQETPVTTVHQDSPVSQVMPALTGVLEPRETQVYPAPQGSPAMQVSLAQPEQPEPLVV